MTAPVASLDERLKQYGTDYEKRLVDAVNQHGSIRAGARAIGVNQGNAHKALKSLEAKAARQGFAPGHFEHGVAAGYAMGKVTVQRGPGGTVERTWERQSPEQANREEAVRDFVAWLAESGAQALAPITAPPPRQMDDLLALYGIGDPHFGLYSWKPETGNDFNLDEAERLTCGAIDRLVTAAPEAGTALLLNVGDYFHADDSTNKTPGHGNVLDVDTRFAKVLQVGLRAMVYAIKRLLQRHARVIVWMMPGNHDPHSSYALALALDAFFAGEPRVEVDLSPSLYKYLRFGSVLIGSHHGHGAKSNDLPLIMATDRAADWGATQFRYWYGGHIHHLTRKEWPGVVFESFRTLAAGDAWHAGQGYRAGRDMQLIVHHKEWGEVERHRCDVAMLAA